VIDFPIPGDVIGLRSLLLRTADHNFSAVTDIVVAEVSSQQLMHMLEHVPRLVASRNPPASTAALALDDRGWLVCA
jgi:CRP-like cAMP-binding protein